jgi:hypothetical protein
MSSFSPIAVTFIDANGVFQISRICETLRAARNWARFLKRQAYVTEIVMYRGGVGGERVS